MNYIALKEIKIKTDDGRYVVRKPGEAVPEAAGWKNVEYWVRAKHIGPAEDEEAPLASEGKPAVKPAVKAKGKGPAKKTSKKGTRIERV